jgi:hypothetical protein
MSGGGPRTRTRAGILLEALLAVRQRSLHWRLKAGHRDGRGGLRSHPRALQRHIHDQGIHASLPQSWERERHGRTGGHTGRVLPHDADTGRPGDVLACRCRHETLGVRSFRMLAFVLESRMEPFANGN